MQEIYIAGKDIPFVDQIRARLSDRPFICRELSALMACHSNITSAVIRRFIEADIVDEFVDLDDSGVEKRSDTKIYFLTSEGKSASILNLDTAESISLDKKEEDVRVKIRRCLVCAKEFTSKHFGHRLCSDHKFGGKNAEHEDYEVHATVAWENDAESE